MSFSVNFPKRFPTYPLNNLYAVLFPRSTHHAYSALGRTTDLDIEPDTDNETEHETDTDNETEPEPEPEPEPETDIETEHETDIETEHETDIETDTGIKTPVDRSAHLSGTIPLWLLSSPETS